MTRIRTGGFITPGTRLNLAAALLAAAAGTVYAQGNPAEGDAGESAAQVLGVGSFRCGLERWGVKTLSDADADKVALDSPQASDIPTLIGSPPSSPWAGLNAGGRHRSPPDVRMLRGATDETKVYALTAYLLRYKYENDGDIHMVIADPTDQSVTMIAESVDPQCNGTDAHADLFTQVRTQFTGMFPDVGQPGQFIDVQPPALVKIAGVRFFDPLHKQNGVAPNGVELHPVIAVQAAAAARSADSATAPPTTSSPQPAQAPAAASQSKPSGPPAQAPAAPGPNPPADDSAQ